MTEKKTEKVVEKEMEKVSKKSVEAKTEKKVEKASKKSIEAKRKELLKKAEELSSKIKTTKLEELKEKVKGKKEDLLVPLEKYVQSGIYIGTKAVTPQLKKYVYRRRADGLAIFNTEIIDEKLGEGIEYLSKFKPEEVVLVCKRQSGWPAAKLFSKVTGIKSFTKKYPAGILTNPILSDFLENELTIISDSWLDKNALNDTIKVNKKILMICDTNNFPKGVSQKIIGNNKSPKSLGLIFYILARGYIKNRKIKAELPELDNWLVGEEPVKAGPRKSFVQKKPFQRARYGV